jgi:hemoglobin-like flavoprotein
MKTELIAETWGALGETQREFVEAFYGRFFARFPIYRPYFPKQLNPAHLEKMVQTMALVANLAEEPGLVAPHMRKVGRAHSSYRLSPVDLDNFKMVFVEMLGERLGPRWSADAERAWSEAFDEVLIPLMQKGLAGG